MVAGKIVQEARRSFEEITKRNIWQIKNELELDDLSDALFYEVPEFLEDRVIKYREKIDADVLTDLLEEMEDDFKLQ